MLGMLMKDIDQSFYSAGVYHCCCPGIFLPKCSLPARINAQPSMPKQKTVQVTNLQSDAALQKLILSRAAFHVIGN